MKELKRWYRNLKAEHFECCHCSENHPCSLVFHHPGEKNLEKSFMVSQGFSKERILEELENCVPLCANCHRKEHIVTIPGGWDFGVDDWKRMDQADLLDKFPNIEQLSKFGYRSSLRTWLHRYKGVIGCERCPEENPECLEFHHKLPEEKTMEVSMLVVLSLTKPDMLSEIDKCDILCRNCHRKEHYKIPAPIS